MSGNVAVSNIYFSGTLLLWPTDGVLGVVQQLSLYTGSASLSMVSEALILPHVAPDPL